MKTIKFNVENNTTMFNNESIKEYEKAFKKVLDVKAGIVVEWGTKKYCIVYNSKEDKVYVNRNKVNVWYHNNSGNRDIKYTSGLVLAEIYGMHMGFKEAA